MTDFQSITDTEPVSERTFDLYQASMRRDDYCVRTRACVP